MQSRRVFLKSGAMALVTLGFAPSFLARTMEAAGTRKKLLIAVFQRGAVDGLNMVVPFGEASYYRARPTIAIQQPGREDGALDLDGFFGLHPRMAPLLPLWQAFDDHDPGVYLSALEAGSAPLARTQANSQGRHWGSWRSSRW